jgi:hypothetical protein
MRHIAFLAFAVAFAFSPAFAQTAPEARVQLLWRQTVSTALPDGRVQASVVPIFIQDDEAVVAVSEALDASARPPMRAWIERIGAGGVRWRYELDHLPPATFIETAPSPVAADGRTLLAVTFQTLKAPPGGEYGRLLSIDLATGAVDRVVPLRYPRIAAHGKPDDEDRLHVFGALRLQDGRIAIYGGDDVGPYRWWLGLRGADGAFLWDAGAPRRG